MEPVKLIVYGLPAPQGSKSGFAVYRKGVNGQREYTGKTRMVESSIHVRPWRNEIIMAVQDRFPDIDLLPGFPIDDPVCGRVVFTMPAIADKRRRWPHKMPDLDKLLRSTLDALKESGVLKDDARLVDMCRLSKVYPLADDEALARPGAYIELHEPHPRLREMEVVEATEPGALFDVR